MTVLSRYLLFLSTIQQQHSQGHGLGASPTLRDDLRGGGQGALAFIRYDNSKSHFDILRWTETVILAGVLIIVVVLVGRVESLAVAAHHSKDNAGVLLVR